MEYHRDHLFSDPPEADELCPEVLQARTTTGFDLMGSVSSGMVILKGWTSEIYKSSKTEVRPDDALFNLHEDWQYKIVDKTGQELGTLVKDTFSSVPEKVFLLRMWDHGSTHTHISIGTCSSS
jgi:hypothetical protein